jgi:hypothetical protein
MIRIRYDIILSSCILHTYILISYVHLPQDIWVAFDVTATLPYLQREGPASVPQQHADIAIIKAMGAAAVGVRMTAAEGMWKSNPRKSPPSPATLAVSVWRGHGGSEIKSRINTAVKFAFG